MTKTTIRGNFPGVTPAVKYHAPVPVKLVDRPFQPVDRHATIRGKSKYAKHIELLMSKPPGQHCLEFVEYQHGKSFVQGLCRYLKQKKLYDKMRPALQQMEKVTCVWVVPYEKEV